MPTSRWGRLDAHAPWQDFASGVGQASVSLRIEEFAPEVVLGVDWTSYPAYLELKRHFAAAEGARGLAPYVFLNYRVFSRTASEEDLEVLSRHVCSLSMP